jgi:transposase
MINLKQYQRLREKYAQTHNMSLSALQTGIDPKTARKYLQGNRTPQQRQQPHTWATRPDPLAGVWPRAEQMLTDAPELEAKVLFAFFLAQPESGLSPGQLRTFQRRVRRWRATHGPEQEVYFPQRHTPGLAIQLDWTHARELGVRIEGEPLDHLLCHCVLPYSNWQWVKRCESESFLSLVGGLQAALGQLGKRPRYLGTDNSSAATHEIGTVQGQRAFNPDYLDVCAHFGFEPVTINVACPQEHGDVESQNGHLKRQLKQHLLLRGSREFAREADYDQFVEGVIRQANRPRLARLAEELAVMKPLPPTRLAEYREVEVRVSNQSTIRVKQASYSVPSRLIGQRLRVRVHEGALHLYLGSQRILELVRARKGRSAVIDFRDVVGPLLRKPGAFANYQHREALYPSLTYRKAYDRLVADHGQRAGVIEYLHLLKLAMDHSVGALDTELIGWLAREPKWRAAEVGQGVQPAREGAPEVGVLAPELASYDQLLGQEGEEVAHVI